MIISSGSRDTDPRPGPNGREYQNKRRDFALAFQANPAAVDDLLRALDTGYPPAPLLSAALGPDSFQVKPSTATPIAFITNKVVEYITNTLTVTNTQHIIVERPSTNTLQIARDLDLLRQQGRSIQSDLATLRTNAVPLTAAALPRLVMAQGTEQAAREPEPARPPPDTTTKKPEKLVATNAAANASEPATATPAFQSQGNEQISTKAATPAHEIAHTGTSPLHVASPHAGSRGASSTSSHIAAKVAVPLAITILLAALLLFGVTGSARQHPARIDLSDASTHNSHEIVLIGSSDVLVLDDAPHSAPKELRGDNAAICRDWLGRGVLLAVEGTSINGLPGPGKFRLQAGDRVTLAESVRGKTWIFGGVSSLESPALEAPIEVNS